jgi:hypothetical protein
MAIHLCSRRVLKTVILLLNCLTALKVHAKTEEQVLYLTAVLIGEYLKTEVVAWLTVVNLNHKERRSGLCVKLSQ